MDSATQKSNTKAAEGTEGMVAGTANYKMQLDQAAKDGSKTGKETEGNDGSSTHPIVDKVSQYVPVVGKLLGKDEKKPNQPSPAPGEIPGPPERPTHDRQIEEFVRDQHRSKTGDILKGMDQ